MSLFVDRIDGDRDPVLVASTQHLGRETNPFDVEGGSADAGDDLHRVHALVNFLVVENRGSDLGCEGVHFFKGRGGEGRDYDLVGHPLRSDRGGDLFDHTEADRLGLDLHVEQDPVIDLDEHRIEGRDTLTGKRLRKPRTGVEFSQISQAELEDVAVTVGGALQGRVVDHHDLPIGAQGDVDLGHVGAEIDGGADGGQGVLGSRAGESPVCDNSGDSPGLVKGVDRRRAFGRLKRLGCRYQQDHSQHAADYPKVHLFHGPKNSPSARNLTNR